MRLLMHIWCIHCSRENIKELLAKLTRKISNQITPYRIYNKHWGLDPAAKDQWEKRDGHEIDQVQTQITLQLHADMPKIRMWWRECCETSRNLCSFLGFWSHLFNMPSQTSRSLGMNSDKYDLTHTAINFTISITTW